MDWLPTLLAAAGDPDIKEELQEGDVRLSGASTRCTWTATTSCPPDRRRREGPAQEIFYFSDDGDLTALRYDDWKMIFMEQKAHGTLRVWIEPFDPLRVPLIYNLRRDPYERADVTSNTYYDWMIDRAFLLVPAQDYVGNFLETFKEFPPRQKAASFSSTR